MYSLKKIRIISLIGAFAFVMLSRAALAVDPPPDGGYLGQNTAEGEDALLNLDTHRGVFNTAVGFHTLTKIRNAGPNTAVGGNALASLKTGGSNTAVGFGALANTTSTRNNTAVGDGALGQSTGDGNTAVGASTLTGNTTGYRNTACGMNILGLNSTGANNTGCGYFSLANVTTGSNNVALGVEAGWRLKTGSNNIDIGADGDPEDSNTIRIGDSETHQATYIAGISGATVAEGVSVVVGADGHLGTVTSSARYKKEVRPMDKASEAILELQPVTFRYEHELDPAGIPQFGLVAEQVEKVNPDLVARDEQGKPYTVRYEAVNAMLLNEFLKEHRKVETQEATIAEVISTAAKQATTIEQQQKQIKALTEALKAQGEQIRHVSDQLQASKLAPRLAANSQ